MTRAAVARERHVWIAVTAVLATSLVWLALLSLAVTANAWTRHFPEALAVLRALGHAALALGRRGGPAALAALAAVAVLIGAVLHPGHRGEGRTRHA